MIGVLVALLLFVSCVLLACAVAGPPPGRWSWRHKQPPWLRPAHTCALCRSLPTMPDLELLALVQLAQLLRDRHVVEVGLAEAERRLALQKASPTSTSLPHVAPARICNEPDEHLTGCDCGNGAVARICRKCTR